MDDGCPICGSYMPRRYGPCSARCEWLFAHLTSEQITDMKQYERHEQERQLRKQEAFREEHERNELKRLQDKYAN